MKRNHLAALLCYLSISTGFSQTPETTSRHFERYYFRYLTVDDGLSQDMISTIQQDHQGFIWIGTRDGLNMYDGYSFRIYKNDPSNIYSISDNYVTVVYEDPLQRLWVGTKNGGVHYLDRKRERFINFSWDPDDQNSISDNHITAIVGDSSGNIWIGTNGRGVNKLSFTDKECAPDKNNVKIMRFDGQENGLSEQHARINTLFIDHNNHLWIGTSQSIFTIDISNSRAKFRKVDYLKNEKTHPSEETKARQMVDGARTIFEDANGKVWMGNAFGLFILDRDLQHFTAYEPSGIRFPLTQVSAATSFINQKTEELWIACEGDICILNPATGNYTRLSNKKEQQTGLKRGRFTCFFADMGGTLWIGSNGNGISLFNPGTIKFDYPDDTIFDSQLQGLSVRDLSIRTLYENSSDSSVLWIGANEGLFKVDRTNSVITPVRIHDLPEEQASIVFHIREDDKGFLWIGTGLGLVRLNPADNKFTLFSTGLSEASGNSDPRVSFVHLNKRTIWVLTPNTIARLDRVKEQFQHFRYNDEPLDGNSEAVFSSMLEDRKGNFWVAARNGLHYFDVEMLKFTNHSSNFNHPNKFVISDIRTIMSSPLNPERYLWLGTGSGGFSRLDLESGKLINYTKKDGLANNNVYGMLPDNEGSIWISTNHGLSRFNIEKESFTNYTKANGLQSNEFNSGAYYKSPRGELFFGGIKGYNCFYPPDIIRGDFMAPVVFTAFELYDETHLKVTDNPFSAWETNELKLNYSQYHYFTIDFASLDYAFPEKNAFAISMTKSGTSWREIGTERQVTFTELKPGKYILKVRGTNSDGVWSDRKAELAIDIGWPWWQNIWAYLIYFSALLGALYSLRKYELSRLRFKTQMEIANIETNKLIELDQHKSQFFANISHEFRTPLTLIQGPLEQLMKENTDLQHKKTFRLMHTNASRLLELINQLLELSRIENGNYIVNTYKGNIVALINGLAMSFASLSDQRKITLRVEISPELEHTEFRNSFYYDPDILEKIINNLISNAFKFTPEGGQIKLKLSLIRENDNKGFLEIVIKDTGMGIPADKLPYIFDRFYQVNKSNSMNYEGSGIGLAYVHELVQAHKGEIHVKSQPGTGAIFSLRFPLGKSHLSSNQIIPGIHPLQTDQAASYPAPSTAPSDTAQSDGSIAYRPGNGNETNKKPWVLIVEDHTEVRQYILESIQNEYRVIQASNGPEGFIMAEEFIPDLIISDIMMPEMDGCEFCKKIKSSEKTSHIPVILLTARADVSDKLLGLETGADDYLSKPFNTEELRIRIRNLIDNRRALRQKFSTNSIITPGEISVTSRDASFMEMLLSLVDKHMANINFSVEELGKEAGMSQSQLHRKLRAIVNMSANQFIRSVRMQRAMELMQNSVGNISEIAYMVGYDDPGYFSKSFRKFYGKLPSEVAIRQ